MPRPTRCHHGTIIKDSWQECPLCWKDHIEAEAADAARESLSENKKQTKILETLNFHSSDFGPSREDLAQQKAKFAEDRLGMKNDLRGAVQLITEAIELDPQFLSFYIQRAVYLVRQGKNDQALSDFYHCFNADSEILLEFEARLISSTLDEFEPLKAKLEILIQEFYESAQKRAIHSIKHTEAELIKMRDAFPEKPLPNFAKSIESDFEKLAALIPMNSYKDLLDIPRLAEDIETRALRAIEGSPRELMKKQLEELKNETENILFSIEIEYRNQSEEADRLFHEVGKLKEESKEYLLTKSLDTYKKALALAKEAKENASRAYDLSSKASWEKTQLRLKIEEEKRKDEARKQYKKNKSKQYAGKLAGLGSFLGSIGGCVACNSGAGVGSFFGGILIGTLGGALMGFIIGQSFRPDDFELDY